MNLTSHSGQESYWSSNSVPHLRQRKFWSLSASSNPLPDSNLQKYLTIRISSDPERSKLNLPTVRSRIESDSQFNNPPVSQSPGRVANPFRVCLWCSQLRGHSSPFSWSVAGAGPRGTIHSALGRHTSPAEVGVSSLIFVAQSNPLALTSLADFAR